MPDRLDELAGPWGGSLSFPAGVYWGPGTSLFDVGDDFSRRRAYRIVLQEESLGDILTVINRDRLVSDWPKLLLPVRLAKDWEERFGELRGNEAATW